VKPDPFAAVAETHISTVFFAGDRAYKLLKPLRTGFLDHSTAERRAVACRRELDLNRRMAPDVYLGVSPIIEHDEVVDHLLVM
jgi:aminoglycoside phosphotransferase family enzyme